MLLDVALKHLARIDESARRMVSLINDLEDTTRAQMGVVLDLDRRPTDVVALVRRVVEQQADHDGAPGPDRAAVVLSPGTACRADGGVLCRQPKPGARGTEVAGEDRVGPESGPRGGSTV